MYREQDNSHPGWPDHSLHAYLPSQPLQSRSAPLPQSPWGQVQRGALQPDTRNATQTRAAKKHQGKTPQYAKNSHSPGCGQILKPSPSLVNREGVHGGSILSGDKQGKANPGFHQRRASHGEQKARLKRKHPGGPARSQQSQQRSAPTPRYAGHRKQWTRDVFSNKTQLIPLGGLLCSKASLFHSTQQSPGGRGAPWAVSHTSALNYGGPSLGAGRHWESSPRCQSWPPRHVSQAEFSRQSRGGRQDHLAVDPALWLSLHEATVLSPEPFLR